MLCACISEPGDDSSNGDVVAVGDSSPSFCVRLHDSRTVTDSDFKECGGLIVFFNTDCNDCRVELPVIQSVYERFPGVLLVCVSRSQDDDAVSRWWDENGLSLPYSAQTDDAVYRLFAKSGIPRIYVLDPEGIVRCVYNDVNMPDYEELCNAIQFFCTFA